LLIAGLYLQSRNLVMALFPEPPAEDQYVCVCLSPCLYNIGIPIMPLLPTRARYRLFDGRNDGVRTTNDLYSILKTRQFKFWLMSGDTPGSFDELLRTLTLQKNIMLRRRVRQLTAGNRLLSYGYVSIRRILCWQHFLVYP
jgi:hypothetical protein